MVCWRPGVEEWVVVEIMTFRKNPIERSPLSGGRQDGSGLELRWREARVRSRWGLDLGEKEALLCYAKGWSGLRLHNLSGMERRAVRAFCGNPSEAAFISTGSAHNLIAVGDGWVSSKHCEVWQKDDARTVGLHEMLLAMPPRTHLGVTGRMIHPLVRPMLRGLNYLSVRSHVTGGSRPDDARLVISVQDHEGVDALLSMLVLTR